MTAVVADAALPGRGDEAAAGKGRRRRAQRKKRTELRYVRVRLQPEIFDYKIVFKYFSYVN